MINKLLLAVLFLFPLLGYALQPVELYVDPSIAGDSGAGSKADPYGDLEYAIEQTTHNTTSGTRVNIKAGTDELPAADLEAALANTATTVAWVCTETAPCNFEGYTTNEGDGGIGGIDGGNSVQIWNSTVLDFIGMKNLHLHNTNSTVIRLDNNITLINVEVNDGAGIGIDADIDILVINSYFHDLSTAGVSVENGYIAFNYFENDGTRDFTNAIRDISNSRPIYIHRNIIDIDGSSDGIAVRSLITEIETRPLEVIYLSLDY